MLNVYKVEPDARIPNYETRKAACFDLSAYIPANEEIKVYAGKTESVYRPEFDSEREQNFIALAPYERALIRTGLIFDIPEGFSMRLHPRSGVALKYGLMLANCEGVVDEDYVNETKLIIYNSTDELIKIYHGDRIAQGEITPYHRADIQEVFEKPGQKSDRIGGFGSTGVR